MSYTEHYHVNIFVKNQTPRLASSLAVKIDAVSKSLRSGASFNAQTLSKKGGTLEYLIGSDGTCGTFARRI